MSALGASTHNIECSPKAAAAHPFVKMASFKKSSMGPPATRPKRGGSVSNYNYGSGQVAGRIESSSNPNQS